MSDFKEQLEKMRNHSGFIAALDQVGWTVKGESCEETTSGAVIAMLAYRPIREIRGGEMLA